jgi:DNA-binding transcriptional regulator/RsmH inhibitor MraZ
VNDHVELWDRDRWRDGRGTIRNSRGS